MTEILKGKIKCQPNSFYRYVANIFPLISEAEDMNIVPAPFKAGKFPRKVSDMNSRAPISMGRIFIGEEGNFHAYFLPIGPPAEAALLTNGPSYGIKAQVQWSISPF